MAGIVGITEASRYVAGYAIGNDISERNWQSSCPGGQWSKGKSFAGFSRVGPWLVPADEVPDPQHLRLTTRVNGELRQDANTSDMLFSVSEIIAHLSQFMVLEPGDVIFTGTPEGVAGSGRFPFLHGGDSVRLTISGLGEQRQQVVYATRDDT